MDKPTDWRSGTRRIFSNEFKLHMVELASKPNANVAQLAREHGVDNNLILNGYVSGKEKDVFLVECLQLFHYGKMTLGNPSPELLTVLIRELTGRGR